MAINRKMTPLNFADQEYVTAQNSSSALGVASLYNGVTTTAATINVAGETINERWHMVSHWDAAKDASIWNHNVSQEYSTGDPIKVEVLWTAVGTGNAYLMAGLSRIASASTGTTSFSENWSNPTFSAGWVTASNATNRWVIGSATSTSGSYSAYISNNGTENTYTNSVTQVSHLYRDVTFDNDSVLTFNWRAWGENGSLFNYYDYGAVCIVATTSTPVAGTEIITTQAAAGGNGRIGATTNLGKFNLVYGGSTTSWHSESIDMSGYAGQTKRLCFTWVNDNSLGSNPPFAIDDILISTQNITNGTLGTDINTEYKAFATFSTAGTDIVNSTTFTFTNRSIIPGEPLSFIIVRDATVASDTITNFFRISGVKWRYNINKLGI